MPSGTSARTSAASVVMCFAVAVIQQLDGEAVARPVHARCGAAATRTASGPSLQTGSCTSTCGSSASSNCGTLQHAGALRKTRTQAKPASWTDRVQTADQDEAEGELKELRKTVHGDRSGPH